MNHKNNEELTALDLAKKYSKSTQVEQLLQSERNIPNMRTDRESNEKEVPLVAPGNTKSSYGNDNEENDSVEEEKDWLVALSKPEHIQNIRTFRRPLPKSRKDPTVVHKPFHVGVLG